ncbi:YbhB/YbcL family Raf kinase inhibitor-like protein [Aquimarina agarivorans]|uniref:YbhB/YbcL family Raf kinase inhibitor-like protein n=1 Tax=Aquimarina agarivorans TaxID=980584 RepID=UPI000248E7B4|nr:YbhB/YbcL family Raf kinase inhibitor-like protein [Aquimarina agarivorans]
MKKITLVIIFLSIFITMTNAQTFTLKSNDIGGQMTTKQVFDGFGCTGKNISPQLHWSNVPEGTKSFAITIHDPSAPTGSGWWHWLIFDIDASVSELASNAGNPSAKLAPKGSIQSITDYGKAGYGGPCPPEGHGFHQYVITIHALKVASLGLEADTNPAVVGFNLFANTIEKASIIAYYKRD